MNGSKKKGKSAGIMILEMFFCYLELLFAAVLGCLCFVSIIHQDRVRVLYLGVIFTGGLSFYCLMAVMAVIIYWLKKSSREECFIDAYLRSSCDLSIVRFTFYFIYAVLDMINPATVTIKVFSEFHHCSIWWKRPADGREFIFLIDKPLFLFMQNPSGFKDYFSEINKK